MKTDITCQAGETKGPATRSFTRHFPTVARLLMGLPLIVFGLNGFFNFIPQPTTPLQEGAAAFAEALMESGYMMQLIGGTQLIVGVLLVLNRFVPLALALFAPFMVNSFAFHLRLEHSGPPDGRRLSGLGGLSCLGLSERLSPDARDAPLPVK